MPTNSNPLLPSSGHGVHTFDELKSPSRPLPAGQMEQIGPSWYPRIALFAAFNLLSKFIAGSPPTHA